MTYQKQNAHGNDYRNNNYNLSPSRYVAVGEKEEYLPIDEALVELTEVEEERKEIDKELSKIMQKIGLAGYLTNEGE